MTTPQRLLVFAVIALLQLGAAAFSLAAYEHTLATGTPMRFSLAPVDPLDPLRGYYAALRFELATVDESSIEPGLDFGARAYAVLANDARGRARVVRVSRERPTSGDYLGVVVRYPVMEGKRQLELPFDRFYLGKADARAAEARFVTARDPTSSYAVVRLRSGRGVIESLVVDGVDARSGRPVGAGPR